MTEFEPKRSNSRPRDGWNVSEKSLEPSGYVTIEVDDYVYLREVLDLSYALVAIHYRFQNRHSTFFALIPMSSYNVSYLIMYSYRT